MIQANEIEFYRENGYLLVKSVITRDGARKLRRECHDLAARLSAHANLDAIWQSAKELTGQKKTTILHTHNVQLYSAAFTRLLVDERFTSAAAALLGSPNVQLHHTKMFIKPPERGSPFPLHQDVHYFPYARHSMFAAILHFDDAPPEKDCVRVVPGSQKRGPLDHRSDNRGGFFLPTGQFPIESAVACPAQSGDVLFFSYLTIHGSGMNTSDEARTTLLVQMRDPTDLPTTDVHRSAGQITMLSGIDPTGIYHGLTG